MLLVLTNSQDATADYLVSVLHRNAVKLLRFDTDTCLPHTTVTFQARRPLLCNNGAFFEPESFTNVWYRRPQRLKYKELSETPEGTFTLDEWAEAFEGFFAQIPMTKWVNHPSKNVAASHKIEQLTTAHNLGLLIPETLVTQDANKLREFYAIHGGRIITKPMARGYVERPTGEKDTVVYTNRVMPEHLTELKDLASCPTLFQEFIDKACDVRITFVDGDFHAVELVAKERDGSQRCDIRRNNMDDVNYRLTTLPTDVESRLRDMMGLYYIRFAAIDMAVSNDGRWYFLEVNPNGQWAWLDLGGVTDIARSFVHIFRKV